MVRSLRWCALLAVAGLCLDGVARAEEKKEKDCCAELINLWVQFVKSLCEDKEPKDPQAYLIGKAAPEITGDFALNGKVVKLSNLKGKVVLVDFWAVWCPPCRAAFPYLNELKTKYKGKGLKIVGVTTYQGRAFDQDGRMVLAKKVSAEDEHGLLKEFAANQKMHYRILTLPTEEVKHVYQDYGVIGIPEFVVIDHKGKVRAIKVGFSEDNMKALDKLVQELLEEQEYQALLEEME